METMRLHNEPFEKIKSGTKTIEIRLNDEKRQKLKVGEVIEFTNRFTGEKLSALIIGLHYFKTFDELYLNFDKISLGYDKDDIADPNDISKYYSKEEQSMYGVVGIEIKLI